MLFNLFDTDKNGRVSFEEYTKACSILGLSEEDEAQLVGQLHINPVHPTLSFALIQTLK